MCHKEGFCSENLAADRMKEKNVKAPTLLIQLLVVHSLLEHIYFLG
jgi:hypothetical protein